MTSGLSYPTGVAIDAGGDVLVATGPDWTGTPRDTPSVVRVDLPTRAAPHGARVDTAAGLGYPRSLAFDADGALWVSTTYGLVAGYALPNVDPPGAARQIAGWAAATATSSTWSTTSPSTATAT
ncbi:MAG: hypothetical protein R3F59_18135 [Myxococcota bacterium]